MKKIALIGILSFYTLFTSAQGWQHVLPTSLTPKSAFRDSTGDCFLLGLFGFNNNYRLIKIDKNGFEKWHHDYPNMSYSDLGQLSILRAPDGKLLMYGHTDSASITEFSLRKLDENGNIVWRKQFDFPVWTGSSQLIKTTKTDFVLPVYLRNGTYEGVLLRLNSNGDTVSTIKLGTNLGGGISDFIIEPDGYTWIKDNTLQKVDNSGRVKWSNVLSFDEMEGGFYQLNKAKDSTYFFNSRYKGIKLDNNGNRVWKKDLPLVVAQSVLNDDGELAIVGIVPTFNNNRKKLEMYKLNKDGSIQWHRQFYTEEDAYLKGIVKLPKGGYFMYGGIGESKTIVLRITEEGFLNSNFLEGKVIRDIDKNCMETMGDFVCKSCLIEAYKSNGDVYKATTNDLGYYSLNVDTGTYTILVYPLTSRSYWQNCTPSVSATFKKNKPIDTLNFYLKPVIVSAAMEVNASTPFIRRCFPNTYSVKFCNKGSYKTDSAYVVVTLDSLLEYMSATRPLISRSGRKYRFNIGKVDIEECGNFDIIARVRCGDSTRLGQTICVEAKIFPDSVITPNSLWTGANIEVTGICQKDSVIFQVKNTGRVTSSSLNGYVIENDIFRFQRQIKLPVAGIFTEKIPATGATWRMTVDQEPNHPTSKNPTAFVEGCGLNSLSLRSAGFATKFANDNKALSLDIDCQPIVGAFDPNDKLGYPTGYGIMHNIAQNQDIDYKIRFQNTGTDTAFTVVVRDTISDKLDIGNIEFGVSSHPYKAEIYGKNSVKFTFDNINLVDSFKNEPKSHGFVNFRIKQKTDLKLGSKINNTASIYFDFNDPIVTNTTLHTVGANTVISTIIEKNTILSDVKVSPNPLIEEAIFELPFNNTSRVLIFQLFTLAGNLIRTEEFIGTRFEFHREKLPTGVYLYKIRDDENFFGMGKVIIL
jgi:hypothetical protein